ncbi:MAG: hypothetical protein HYY50_04890 [Candidatus Kerfeldbacteria bacterium]|nr:hypothetical protein [Candidatus Kerfeldbacteria bacterium]
MTKPSIYLIIGLAVVAVIFSGLYYISKQPKAEQNDHTTTLVNSSYQPVINPADFSTTINNRFFTLVPGQKFSYQNSAAGSNERIETEVTNEIKTVMDVATVEVRDRAWVDNQLAEDTRDWYAQAKNGDVWYFGEAVDNYENGKLKNHDGSWEVGIDGAKPGIVMLANPKVGDRYRQEYYAGIAEDMGDVVALEQTVRVPSGTFDHCLQTRDWSVVEKSLNEYKYYCPQVGFVVLEESVKGGEEQVELVNVTTR